METGCKPVWLVVSRTEIDNDWALYRSELPRFEDGSLRIGGEAAWYYFAAPRGIEEGRTLCASEASSFEIGSLGVGSTSVAYAGRVAGVDRHRTPGTLEHPRNLRVSFYFSPDPF